MSEEQSYDVVLEADFTDPALAPAVFQLLREAGKLHDLPNIGWTRIHMTVEVDGYAHPSQLDSLRDHFDRLWLGGIQSVKVRQRTEAAE